jgi:hypothetical protein
MGHRLTRRFWASMKITEWKDTELSRLTEVLREEIGDAATRRRGNSPEARWSHNARAYHASRRGRARAK